MAATETPTYIGAPVPRREDKKLLTGQGSFVDNLTLPGMLWMALVRSPYAHARIVGVDVARAAGAPGVVAAYTGHDLAEEWGGSLPCAWPVTEDIEMPPHWPLAQDKARYEGDAVAVVVADSRAAALDAAELVQVEWEPLPAVTDVAHALDEGAPLVHDNLPSNKCYVWPLEGGDVAGAFADAEVTVSERYRQQRLIPSAIEPRGVLVQPVPATGELTLWSATQVPHILRVTLSGVLGMPEAKLRVIAPDVGGGFGSKLNVYAEEALALALARRLGRPVKWTEERTEGFQATIHGRDVIQEIELAATKEGRITGVRVRLTAAMGAYLQLVTPGIPLLGAWIYNGAYDIPAYGFECTGVFTNTTPTDAYRGAGRPEATYAIERTIDALARAVGKDPVEIRRLNFIKEFPHTIASGLTIDSGNYDATLDRVLELAGYETLRADQAARR
ncbi:MAG: xanthine dehydrogenase family protein molybdopterin-binding subunit, partial [Gaiellaceae bacterium]